MRSMVTPAFSAALPTRLLDPIPDLFIPVPSGPRRLWQVAEAVALRFLNGTQRPDWSGRADGGCLREGEQAYAARDSSRTR